VILPVSIVSLTCQLILTDGDMPVSGCLWCWWCLSTTVEANTGTSDTQPGMASLSPISSFHGHFVTYLLIFWYTIFSSRLMTHVACVVWALDWQSRGYGLNSHHGIVASHSCMCSHWAVTDNVVLASRQWCPEANSAFHPSGIGKWVVIRDVPNIRFGSEQCIRIGTNSVVRTIMNS